MIRLEDRELEEYVISEESHIALPFELHKKSDGSIDIVCYSFTESVAREFESRFSENPFSEEAKNFLSEKLVPIMNEFGYDCTGASDRVHIEYRCKNVCKSRILENCEIISTLDGEKWDSLPLYEFALDGEDENDRMAVIRHKGKIVCFAGLNDISEDNGCAELTVECEENYRGRGYAASCVALLADYLMSHGVEVNYICTEDNVASMKTAEAVGFEIYDKCLPFVCYRENDSEEYEEF